MSKIQAAIRKIQITRVSAPGTPHKVQHGDALMRRGKVLHFDMAALQKIGLIVADDQKLQIENQYREIKRPLIAHAFGKRATQVTDGRLVMITSSIAGEGKTRTCINLAMSLGQELDYSVLLVDADVVKPHISEIFEVGDSLGLLDLLEDTNLDPNEYILATDVPGISVLPAGAPRMTSTELLSGSRMDDVIAQLLEGRSNRLIIFDSPPLLETNEAKILAGLVGQVLLVVKAGHTPQEVVLAALATVPEDKAINLVLNQTLEIKGGGQYTYGYGYAKNDESVKTRPQERDDWG